ncbi:hypothetical protein NDU88_006098 [Pleurodeles waltl]|uniref:Uncharacterized protein n=1 Tax=Pleurodeles waltl TaxID=8319 RepID=A0AAV7RNL2_PLEWA|nr:hypothetical protein NDU88_006098 [Pleurodeles waltl]
MGGAVGCGLGPAHQLWYELNSCCVSGQGGVVSVFVWVSLGRTGSPLAGDVEWVEEARKAVNAVAIRARLTCQRCKCEAWQAPGKRLDVVGGWGLCAMPHMCRGQLQVRTSEAAAIDQAQGVP